MPSHKGDLKNTKTRKVKVVYNHLWEHEYQRLRKFLSSSRGRGSNYGSEPNTTLEMIVVGSLRLRLVGLVEIFFLPPVRATTPPLLMAVLPKRPLKIGGQPTSIIGLKVGSFTIRLIIAMVGLLPKKKYLRLWRLMIAQVGGRGFLSLCMCSLKRFWHNDRASDC
jgi:hypothetical protein